MVSVQRSIEIRVPVHTLYSQLTQFEDYPQFMQDIESVEQRDATHLHWKAGTTDQPIEWDAVITECVPDQHIAWQSENGPGNAGKIELQPVGSAASRLTLTLVSEIDFEPISPAGDVKAELSERIWEDLARLRSMVESKEKLHGSENGAGHGALYKTQAQDAVETVLRDRGSPGNPVPVSGLAAGSEGFSADEDRGAPVTSASHQGDAGKEFSESNKGGSAMHVSELSRREKNTSMQSDYSLSQGREEGMQDERDSIAEEVNFDQQSDAVRHIGNLPDDDAMDGANQGLPNSEVIAKATQRKNPEPEF